MFRDAEVQCNEISKEKKEKISLLSISSPEEQQVIWGIFYICIFITEHLSWKTKYYQVRL